MVPSASQIGKINGVYNAIQLVGDAVGGYVLYSQPYRLMPTGDTDISDDVHRAAICSPNAAGFIPACVISTRWTAAPFNIQADGRNHVTLLLVHGPGPAQVLSQIPV